MVKGGEKTAMRVFFGTKNTRIAVFSPQEFGMTHLHTY
jgi:hypothetical protein